MNATITPEAIVAGFSDAALTAAVAALPTTVRDAAGNLSEETPEERAFRAALTVEWARRNLRALIARRVAAYAAIPANGSKRERAAAWAIVDDLAWNVERAEHDLETAIRRAYPHLTQAEVMRLKLASA